MYKQNSKLRPLTKKMIEVLIECQEREDLKFPPFEATAVSIKGLIFRQLVSPIDYVDDNGKKTVCVTLTQMGKYYLTIYKDLDSQTLI